MFKFGALLKWGIGVFLGLSVVAVAWVITQAERSPIETIGDKSKPEITGLSVENNCDVRIDYIDHMPTNAVVFLRRSVGGSNHFDQIKVADNHGDIPSHFLDEQMPAGSYQYEVGYFDPEEAVYSKISAPVVVGDVCGTAPLVIKPLNPFITSVEVFGACTARVWLVVYAEDADGVRMYRQSSGGQPSQIDEMTLAEWNASKGNYDDSNLPPGAYRYRASAFNANGESFSDWSEEVVISDPACAPAVISTFSGGPALVLVTATVPPPTVTPQPCIWQANVNVFLRKGPGAGIYDKLLAVEKGKTFPIVGQSEDGQFWAVEIEQGVTGYVSKSEKYSRTSGDCAGAPTLRDPEPPVIEPVPTKRPKGDEGGAQNTIPQCSDGIDNDGDGAVDMRDLAGCSDPNDAIEN